MKHRETHRNKWVTCKLHLLPLFCALQGVFQDLGRADDHVTALHHHAEEVLLCIFSTNGHNFVLRAEERMELLREMLVHQMNLR